jgi:hypothetical protein
LLLGPSGRISTVGVAQREHVPVVEAFDQERAMITAHPFTAAAFLVATLASGVDGMRPAMIEHSSDLVRVDEDVTVISGKLSRPVFARGLFRIGSLWFQASDAPFHDWLLNARGRQAAVTLTTNAERYVAAKNTKVLSGIPVHETVPSVSPVVHMMLLQETVVGNVAATFQTTDVLVARRLETCMANPGTGARVSVVIRVE